MSEVSRTEFESWNEEERLYGLVVARRRARTPFQWVFRRGPSVDFRSMSGVKTRRDAMRDAHRISEEFPCSVLLFDIEGGEFIGKWVTDPDIRDVRVEKMGGPAL